MRVVVALVILFSLLSPNYAEEFPMNGTVLELNESNFDAAISEFDYILVDFYASWCFWSKRLAPQLDIAAAVLGETKQPIVIAKVDASEIMSLGRKYKINGYPTLKMFVHGVSTEDYYGDRHADIIVEYLKKFVAPKDALVDSHTAI